MGRIVSILLLLLPLSASGALPKLRPYTGIALLLLRPAPSGDPGKPPTLVCYREPGIGRIAEPGYGNIPLLRQVVEAPPGEFPVAVLGKRGTWLKIAYDGADREGWIEMGRRWDLIPWEEYLPGRAARFLPGLKKIFYLLRNTPSMTDRTGETLAPESVVRIDRVAGDWVGVTVAPGKTGWLRWRDDEGRFLITVRPDRR
jgi:hypothetical protein